MTNTRSRPEPSAAIAVSAPGRTAAGTATGRQAAPSGDVHNAYVNEVKPRGILLNWGGTTQLSMLNGKVPLSTVRGAGGVDEIKNAIAQASADWDGTSPLFLSIGVLAWNTTPTDLKTVTDSLGPQYKVIRADQFFDLAKKASS